MSLLTIAADWEAKHHTCTHPPGHTRGLTDPGLTGPVLTDPGLTGPVLFDQVRPGPVRPVS